MKRKFFRISLLCLLLAVSGCFEETVRTPGGFDALLDTVSTLAAANVTSAPINPYATPINIGLAGVIAILEALRRKERSSRKHAEQELNGNGNGK